MIRALSAVLAISLLGCATDDPGPATYGTGLGTPDNPIPHDESYTLRSLITVSADVDQLDATIAGMKAFALDPGGTLMAKAKEAGSAAVTQLTSSLSTTLDEKLDGWLNDAISAGRIAGKTPQQYATDVAGMVTSALSQITLESSLSITPEAVTHTLTGLNFRPSGLDVVVPVGGLVADVLIQHPTVTVGEAGALSLGDEQFGLAYGAHAWQGINLAGTSLYGADVASSLSSGLRCDTLAQTIAAKCVNTSCVGHASQIQAICEAGITKLAGDLRSDIAAFSVDSLRFSQGNARLVDDDKNGEADRIVDGMWTAAIDAGAGSRAVTATFTALH
jgi:hypothetical protein